MPTFLQRNDIEKLVETSNTRCGVKHGLTSARRSPVLRLQSAEAGVRREKFLDQVGDAASELDRSVLLPNLSRYCLLVSDADGIIIESYAPEGLEADFQQAGLAFGGVWDERVAGTSGISLSLKTGRVMTIRGRDHFHRCFANYACSSAPLTDGQNNLIGTVTLVGSLNRTDDEIALCEQALRRASRQLQTRLFRNFHADKMTARVMSRDMGKQRSFETMVACDDAGVVVSYLPLWRDSARPAEHQGLVGRHLSDLHELDISLRGPATVPPRRRTRKPEQPQLAARIDKSGSLARLVELGGSWPVMADRARKLIAHRVPVLICGEPGVGSEDFARALLQDLDYVSPLGVTLDAASSEASADLAEALHGMQFLNDYPVDRITPTLILRNVEKLDPSGQSVLAAYLAEMERDGSQGYRRDRPVVLCTAGICWQDIEARDEIDRNLLYLMGQAVLELPALRNCDRTAAVRMVLTHEHPKPMEISAKAREILNAYEWPGNLRELRAVLREAVICGNGERVNSTDLPPRLTAAQSQNNPKEITRQTLREALNSTNWNVSKTAVVLGKSRATINRWIASEGLQRPE